MPSFSTVRSRRRGMYGYWQYSPHSAPSETWPSFQICGTLLIASRIVAAACRVERSPSLPRRRETRSASESDWPSTLVSRITNGAPGRAAPGPAPR